ncbi:MAG: 30S ribosomal protein S6--L-glutamate ligase [Rickettsiales bacterium]
MTENKKIIGCEEWCSFPELDLKYVKARVDSGAKTSSIHAFNIQPYEEGGEKYVKFDVHPLQGNRKIVKNCSAKLKAYREIKSSTGHIEKRHIIETKLKLGKNSWSIEVSLSNRDSMGYRLLLGRQAMAGKVIVDPDNSFLLGKTSEKRVEDNYKSSHVIKNKLKILILASNPDLYSHRRLMEAGSALGHDMQFLKIKQCYMDISASDSKIHYGDGKILQDVDAVIPRLRPSITFYGSSILRQLESAGIFCVNGSIAITRSRDKLRSLQLLSAKNINIPITAFADSPQNTKDIIKIVGGAPLIIKLLEGTQGKGVVLAETNKAAESVIDAFKSLSTNILVQEYVKEAQNKDLRCFVVGNKVVAAMQRTAPDGEFRANVHLGATVEGIKVTPAERKLAIDAAKVLGLKVAGVDILRLKSGAKVLEVNSSPGLEGIEKASGVDVASHIIKYIEKQLLGHNNDAKP